MSYGKNGTLGVLTPQANTIVEPEFWTLLPPGWSLINARLTSSLDTIEKRLVDYTQKFESTPAEFANAPISAITIACTGTSYLIGHDEETRITTGIQRRYGVPCITSAQASVAALRELNAIRIALLTPYPESLNKVSVPFWQSHGFDVVAHCGPAQEDDAFHPIYAMAEQGVCVAYEKLSDSNADAVLMLGTGMATLGALLHGQERGLLPAVSCNLALVWHAINCCTSNGDDSQCSLQLADWQSGQHWQQKYASMV